MFQFSSNEKGEIGITRGIVRKHSFTNSHMFLINRAIIFVESEELRGSRLIAIYREL